MTLSMRSSAFTDHGDIPVRYTCDGDGISPALTWSGAPQGVASYALIVDDPDAPDPKAPKMTWVHWVVYNIPEGASGLNQDAGRSNHPAGGDVGVNSWNKAAYGGPCPPVGKHRYFFKLYALNTRLKGLQRPTKGELLSAMQGHILAQGQLIGLYRRQH